MSRTLANINRFETDDEDNTETGMFDRLWVADI